MEEKKNIPSNSIYTAVYKNGKVTNEYIPLLDIKLKGKVSLKDKLLEYENLFSELVAERWKTIMGPGFIFRYYNIFHH